MSWANYVRVRIRKQFSSKKLKAIMERLHDRHCISYEEIYDHAHDTELRLSTAKAHIKNLLIYVPDSDNTKFVKDNAILFIKENTL